MPLSALRLINPPWHSRRSAYPRYAGGGYGDTSPASYGRPRWSYNEGEDSPPKTNPKKRRSKVAKPKRKWKSPPRYKAGPKKGQFKPKAARKVKRRRNPEAAAPAAKTNPRRRRKARKNPVITAAQAKRFEEKWRAEQKKKLAAAKRKAKRKTAPKTKRTAAKKTAPKRKPRTGGKTVAKRKKARKAKKSGKRRVTAKQRAAARRNIKKAHAANRRRGGSKKRKAAPKRRKTAAKRRRSSVTLSPGRTVRGRVSKKGKTRKYKVVKTRSKTKKGKKRTSLGLRAVRKNPMAAFKSMAKTGLMVFGGVMGMRVINNLLNKYVISRFSGSMPAQIVPILPALGGFVFAGFAGKFIKKPALLQAVQMGATLALFEAAFNSFVKPHLPAQVSGLLGVDDMGFRGYGRTLGEYVAQPAQLGATAYEAMALDEYIPGNAGVGAFDVSEALADNEVEAFQRGYAGGSLSKTSLGS